MLAFPPRTERRADVAPARYAQPRKGPFGFPGPGPMRPAFYSGQSYNAGSDVTLTASMLSTPNSAALNFNDDLEIALCMEHTQYLGANFLFGMYNFNDNAASVFMFYRSTNVNTYLLSWRDSGGTLRTATFNTAGAMTVGVMYWMRVTLDLDNGASGYTATMQIAVDADEYPTNGWTTAATVTVGGVTSLRSNGTASLVLYGDDSQKSTIASGGVCRQALVFKGIGDARQLRARFAASDVSHPRQTTITSTRTGEKWTYVTRNGWPITTLADTGVVLCEGDSITAGFGAGAANSYPTLMSSSLHGTPSVLNPSRPGDTIVDLASQAADWQTPYRPDVPAINVLWIGTNDLMYSTDGPTTFAALKAVCLERRALGWKVIVLTCMPRTDAGSSSHATRYLIYNALIRSQWVEFADAMVDVVADPRLANSANTAFFSTDKVHLNAAGQAVVASLVAPVVNRFL
jgi:lysophospholipase L1-like esterase